MNKQTKNKKKKKDKDGRDRQAEHEAWELLAEINRQTIDFLLK